MRSVYRSVEGFSQSKLTHYKEPSFASESSLFSSSLSSEQLDHFIRSQHKLGATTNYHHQQQQSSTLLSIYTACIIALIIYTLMKGLGARFNDKFGRRAGIYQSNYHCSRSNREERDIRSTVDKRKLTRMSRGERIRELIRQHGGKNVSSAIKFLATELEKQKQSLLENLSHERSICSCHCHYTGDLGNITDIDGEKNVSERVIADNLMSRETSTSDEKLKVS